MDYQVSLLEGDSWAEGVFESFLHLGSCTFQATLNFVIFLPPLEVSL